MESRRFWVLLSTCLFAVAAFGIYSYESSRQTVARAKAYRAKLDAVTLTYAAPDALTETATDDFSNSQSSPQNTETPLAKQAPPTAQAQTLTTSQAAPAAEPDSPQMAAAVKKFSPLNELADLNTREFATRLTKENYEIGGRFEAELAPFSEGQGTRIQLLLQLTSVRCGELFITVQSLEGAPSRTRHKFCDQDLSLRPTSAARAGEEDPQIVWVVPNPLTSAPWAQMAIELPRRRTMVGEWEGLHRQTASWVSNTLIRWNRVPEPEWPVRVAAYPADSASI